VIGRLTGDVETLDPGEVLIDAGGVGYRVAVSPGIGDRLDGTRQSLWIHTNVREDAIQLYGFTSRRELEVFERLIAVAGVGPRTGLGLLSVCTPDDIAEAVEHGDVVRLQRAPGVGRKTAERVVLELRGKLVGGGTSRDASADAESALMNLGYSQRDARRAVQAVREDTGGGDLGEVIRLALQRLAR
jgi:Holliday junction DNA helicase RuvA